MFAETQEALLERKGFVHTKAVSFSQCLELLCFQPMFEIPFFYHPFRLTA